MWLRNSNHIPDLAGFAPEERLASGRRGLLLLSIPVEFLAGLEGDVAEVANQSCLVAHFDVAGGAGGCETFDEVLRV